MSRVCHRAMQAPHHAMHSIRMHFNPHPPLTILPLHAHHHDAGAMSTLYSYLLAFNPQKVLLAIAETGFECRVQQVNLFNGDSLRPWFMRINPNSTVPVLVVNEVRGETDCCAPGSCASTPTQPCRCWWSTR